jgi:hypothetical protein
MPRFKVGDRVQLVGDIAHFYTCIVGLVVGNGAYPASVLNQYKVRMADGTEGVFFDFQLHTPPITTARVIFDSALTPKPGSNGDEPASRHLHFAGRDIDIHIHLTGSTDQILSGKVTAGATLMRKALVTLLIQDEVTETTATDDSGEFKLRKVPPGDVSFEIFVPSRRVIASLSV